MKRKNNRILTVFFLLLAAKAFSQDINTCIINGYITDSRTGEICSGACIRIGSETAVTNSHGYYSMKVSKGKYPVYASCVGYSPFAEEIAFNGDTGLPVRLQPGIELEEITVKANNRIENRGLGNLRINLSQIYHTPMFLGERDIVKSMQLLPGVSSGMEASSSLVIRGGGNDQTLFMMDDAPLYSQNHAFGFISVFNSDAVLSADIYKGGIPTVYGNRLSGVASIALKDGNMKTHRQNISLGLIAGTLSAEGPILKDKASYLFTARRSFIDLLLNGAFSLTSEGEFSAPQIMFWDINGKISWKMGEKTKLTAGVYTGYDMLGFLSQEKDSETGKKIKDKFGLGWKTATSSLRLTSSLKPNLFLSSNIYYSQLDNFEYHKIKAPGFNSDQQRMSRIQETGWRSSTEAKLSNRQTLYVGADISGQFFTPDFQVNIGKDVKPEVKKLFTFSLFGYDELKFHDWTLTPGLRVSCYRTGESGKVAVEPRLKVSKTVGENNRFMLACDRMTQPVHSLYEMSYSIQTDYWLPFINNKLPVSDQISAGWKNYLLSNLTFSVETYYKKLRNLMFIHNMERFMDYNTDYEWGSGSSRGVELMAQYDKNRWNGMLSYTLSKSDRTFSGRTVPFKYDVPHEMELFTGYDIYKINGRKNTLSLNMNYHTGLPFYLPEVSYPSMPVTGVLNRPLAYNYTWYNPSIDYISEFPNMRIKDYFRIDLNFTMEKQLKHGKKIWQFSLLNATANDNPYNVYRNTKGKYKAFVLIPFFPSLSYRREF
jgi:outer membrane receptor protein involved in Fe transport